MSYSKIRPYFKQAIESVNPSFTEWKDALVFDDVQNVPGSILDRSYHIEIGTIGSTLDAGGFTTKGTTVIVTIFKKGFNSPQDALDELLDVADCIDAEVTRATNVEIYKAANNISFEKIDLLTITPSEIDTSNDNVVQCKLEFNVTILLCA